LILYSLYFDFYLLIYLLNLFEASTLDQATSSSASQAVKPQATSKVATNVATNKSNITFIYLFIYFF